MAELRRRRWLLASGLVTTCFWCFAGALARRWARGAGGVAQGAHRAPGGAGGAYGAALLLAERGGECGAAHAEPNA